jgi:hypothetical protein
MNYEPGSSTVLYCTRYKYGTCTWYLYLVRTRYLVPVQDLPVVLVPGTTVQYSTVQLYSTVPLTYLVIMDSTWYWAVGGKVK